MQLEGLSTSMTRFSVPFSNARKISFSSESSLLIRFTRIPFCGFPTRNYGFEEYHLIRFDIWHQIRIAFDDYDGDLLASVTLLVWVLEDVNLVTRLNMKYNFLERYTRAPLSIARSFPGSTCSASSNDDTKLCAICTQTANE